MSRPQSGDVQPEQRPTSSSARSRSSRPGERHPPRSLRLVKPDDTVRQPPARDGQPRTESRAGPGSGQDARGSASAPRPSSRDARAEEAGTRAHREPAPSHREKPPGQPPRSGRRAAGPADGDDLFGPGMSISERQPAAAASSDATRRMAQLTQENAELREEMRQLRGMLGAGHGAPVAEAVSALVRRNQMLKAQNVQLERQVVLLEDELRQREDMGATAEACLAEALQRLRAAPLADDSAPAQQQHWAAFQRWAQAALHRLAQSARSTARRQDRAEGGPEPGPPTVACAGNKFLQRPTLPGRDEAAGPRSAAAALSVSAVARGAHIPHLLAHPEQIHRLEERLSALGGELGSLAVLLRTAVLPSLRALDDELAVGLQGQVAELAAAVAGASRDLCDLSVLTPSRGALTAAAVPAAKAQVARETRLAGVWGDVLEEVPELDLDAPLPMQFTLPTAAEAAAALPPPACDSKPARRVVQELMDRVANREALHAIRFRLLEAELHHVAAVQLHQADQWRALQLACVGAAERWQGAESAAARRVSDSLRTLLELSAALQADPSEANLRKLVKTMQLHHHVLAQAPGLLEAPPQLGSLDGALLQELATLESFYRDVWADLCDTQDAVRRDMLARARERVARCPEQEAWASEARHHRNEQKAREAEWQAGLRGAEEAQPPRPPGARPASPPAGRGRRDGKQAAEGRGPAGGGAPGRQPRAGSPPAGGRPAFDLSFLTPPPEPPRPEAKESGARSKKAAKERPPFQLDFTDPY
eukprot:jgi/Tetstr1/426379/TSEL_016691.t1